MEAVTRSIRARVLPVRPLAFLLVLLVHLPGPSTAQEAAEVEAPSADVEQALETAKMLLKAGELTVAAEGFRRVLRLDRQHSTARSYLAECHLALGEADQAREVAAGGDPGGVIFGLRVEMSPVAPRVEGPDSAEAQESLLPVPLVEADAVEPSASVPPSDAPAPEAGDEAPEAGDDAPACNPRADSRAGAGLAAFAPVVGGGLFLELRPHWSFSVTGSAGGAVWSSNAAATGVFTFAVEFSWLALPFAITPELGAGFVGLVGDGAWALVDGRVGAPFAASGRRALPYARFGARFDGRGGWMIGAGVVLAPDPTGTAPVPFPSIRVGGRFR